jgi:single-strand DNA-binding protein
MASRNVTTAAPDAAVSRNEILLVGRLSGEVTDRELPSGDVLTSWRLVVDRGPDAPAAPEGRTLPSIDTIDCSTHRRQVQRRAAGWVAGDVLEIKGALRRRFWRGPHGLASRYEVEAVTARRVVRAAPRRTPGPSKDS